MDLRSSLLPPADEPWMTNGGIIAGAVVRSAAVGLRASGARTNARMKGRGSAIVDAFLNMPASLWVERSSLHLWSVTLGLRSSDPTKVIYDWQLTVQCVPEEYDALVQIRTPRYRMSDGALVHGDLHDYLRDTIADGFTAGAGDAQDAEVLLSRLGLAKAELPTREAALDSVPTAFEIRTNLTKDQILRILPRVGFPVLAAARDACAWRLGLSEDSRVAVNLSDLDGQRQVTGILTVAPAGNRMADLVTQLCATTFCDRLRSLIGREDPRAQWLSPTKATRGEAGGNS